MSSDLPPPAHLPSHSVLRKVANNPTEQKFRRIKRTAVEKRLRGVRAGLDLLRCVGFQATETHFVLPPSADIGALLLAVGIFQKRAEERRRAEAALQKVLKENTAKSKALTDKKREHARIMKKRQESSQKEVRDKVVVASKANSLSFGMKLKKFEPPPQPKGGG